MKGAVRMHPTKDAVDVFFASLAGVAFLDIIPAITAVISAIWLSARVYEMFTGREFHTSNFARWITRRKKR